MPISKGPLGYENWSAAQAGAPLRELFEVYLYSDATIVGEVVGTTGPYAFLNALAFTRRTPLAPVMALRIGVHLEWQSAPMTETDTTRYHGGSLADELAALASLALGIRLQAGGTIRDFYSEDQYGRPRADVNAPTLLPFATKARLRIPRAGGEHNIQERLPELLLAYAKLSPQDAVAIVRAARLYQNALWVAESQPELAWLLLVSALEAVATTVHVQSADPAELLATSNPQLADCLKATGGSDHLEEVARHLIPTMKSVSRFQTFVLNNLPEAPAERPPEYGRVNWSRSAMKRALSKIYDYRSRALHDGTPFPSPMSGPESHPSEVPFGRAIATSDAVWTKEDMPMLLHVFEYIAQRSLTKWWRTGGSIGG